MKLFKITDMVVQILVLTITAGMACIDNGEYAFYFYFITGGSQLLSCIVNLLAVNDEYKNLRLRKIYHVTLLFLIATTIFIATEGAFVILFFYLFFTPVMAVYYLVVCINEVAALKERPLALLK